MSETRFLESIKMPPLTLQKDARASSYSVSHHYQTQRKSVSLLWADKTEQRAEKQTDRTAVAQSTSLNSWHICHRGWNIHNNRQESSITGSETHCADGCMGWVRQMRLRLLMAARCLNPSLITQQIGVYRRFRQLELNLFLSSIWRWHAIRRKVREFIQQSASHNRTAQSPGENGKYTVYHIIILCWSLSVETHSKTVM